MLQVRVLLHSLNNTKTNNMSLLEKTAKTPFIRKTYDYKPEQIKMIDEIAVEHNITRADLVRYAMEKGLEIVQEELKKK